MKIKKMPGGDFLVHSDADLRSLAERKMFVAVGRGKWARRPKPKGKDAIRHIRIGRVLYHELRAGSGTKTWKS